MLRACVTNLSLPLASLEEEQVIVAANSHLDGLSLAIPVFVHCSSCLTNTSNTSRCGLCYELHGMEEECTPTNNNTFITTCVTTRYQPSNGPNKRQWLASPEEFVCIQRRLFGFQRAQYYWMVGCCCNDCCSSSREYN